MNYQELALQSFGGLIFVCVRIAFLIFLFKILLKLNKYLDRQLKHDCTTCEYKQKCVKDELANLPSSNGIENM